MIPDKYQDAYLVFHAILELGGKDINQRLKTYRESLDEKYGKRFMESLWDRFVTEYGR